MGALDLKRSSMVTIDLIDKFTKAMNSIQLPQSQRVLRVQRINPHCGCSDKGFYTLFESSNGVDFIVMGSDEFLYKSEVEFQAKLGKLAEFHKATIIIEP